MAAIEKPESWPFPAGMGGFAGDLILTKTSTLMSTAVIPASWAIGRIEIGLGYGLLTLALLGPCLGLSLAEWGAWCVLFLPLGRPFGVFYGVGGRAAMGCAGIFGGAVKPSPKAGKLSARSRALMVLRGEIMASHQRL